MLVTKLDIVNACLSSMGESPANSLNEANSFITSALNALAITLPSEQSFGWYFNMERVNLTPTVDGEYYVPADILGLVTEQSPNWMAIRGQRLYDRSAGSYLLGDRQLVVSVIRNLPLEDLPFHAQRLVQAATVVYFQKSYDGDDLKIRDAEGEYNKARSLLMAEHIRSVRANMIMQGPVGIRRAINRNSVGHLYRG